MSSIVLSRKSTFEGEQNISSDKVCTKPEMQAPKLNLIKLYGIQVDDLSYEKK